LRAVNDTRQLVCLTYLLAAHARAFTVRDRSSAALVLGILAVASCQPPHAADSEGGAGGAGGRAGAGASGGTAGARAGSANAGTSANLGGAGGAGGAAGRGSGGTGLAGRSGAGGASQEVGGEGGDELSAGAANAGGANGGTSATAGAGGSSTAGADAGGEGGAGGEAGGVAADTTFRLATFNIQNFGPTKLGRPLVLAELAAIVRRYPFVAVQELSDVNQNVPYGFLSAINSTGRAYAMLLSPRSGQQPDDRTYQEQYAFYYDTAELEPLSTGALFDDATNDWFVREPYLARFRALRGGFTFVAVTFHGQPDNAVGEMSHLHDVLLTAAQSFPDEDDFILLGDLNAGCAYASPAELDTLPLRDDAYLWLVPDTADTNLAASRCAYDRIIVTRATATNVTGAWGVDEAFVDTGISDHWPVWGEVWAGERD
jgi:endonuclease/exonuclease/phosphatase family metal-dependent hydrolase